MTFSRDLTGASTLPSPDSRELDGGSEGADITSSPAAIATTTQQPNNNKSTTTKRKRENRYKDAPPSVLSVGGFPPSSQQPCVSSIQHGQSHRGATSRGATFAELGLPLDVVLPKMVALSHGKSIQSFPFPHSHHTSLMQPIANTFQFHSAEGPKIEPRSGRIASAKTSG